MPASRKKEAASAELLLHADSILAYAQQQNANTDYAILIDMSIPSWEKRYFLLDLNKNSVLISGMCAHGEGSEFKVDEVVFSNVPQSHCTSKGRYKIGEKYDGRYGTSYRLHGLDATNDKAFERFIVLHGHDCVTDIEGEPTCLSLGCPMVSRDVLNATAEILDAVEKPVLMWVYK